MTTAKFPGRFESLEPISEFVAEAAIQAGLDDAAVYGVQLAVDEAATNIIEHGYGGEGIGDIELTCEIGVNQLIITLHDHARPFDPPDISEPQSGVPLDELKPRGLGLFFIHKMMDEVKFKSSPRGNTLTMVKRKNSR